MKLFEPLLPFLLALAMAEAKGQRREHAQVLRRIASSLGVARCRDNASREQIKEMADAVMAAGASAREALLAFVSDAMCHCRFRVLVRASFPKASSPFRLARTSSPLRLARTSHAESRGDEAWTRTLKRQWHMASDTNSKSAPRAENR